MGYCKPLIIKYVSWNKSISNNFPIITALFSYAIWSSTNELWSVRTVWKPLIRRHNKKDHFFSAISLLFKSFLSSCAAATLEGHHCLLKRLQCFTQISTCTSPKPGSMSLWDFIKLSPSKYRIHLQNLSFYCYSL